MLTALQQRKLARLFKLYDVDRNGFIEQADFAQIAHKTALAMGHQPGSPAYNTIQTQNIAGWIGIAQLGDQDHDQRLTLDEYLVANDKLLAQPEQFTPMMLGILRTIITLLDTDKDDKVSAAEYAAYLAVWGATAAEITDAFGRLDHNGDGYLTADELHQNAQEFFFSDDPAAPGNWLVGPF